MGGSVLSPQPGGAGGVAPPGVHNGGGGGGGAGLGGGGGLGPLRGPAAADWAWQPGAWDRTLQRRLWLGLLLRLQQEWPGVALGSALLSTGVAAGAYTRSSGSRRGGPLGGAAGTWRVVERAGGALDAPSPSSSSSAASRAEDGNEAARILAVADEGVASEIMSKVEKTGKDMELSAMALRDIKANDKKLPTILDAVKYVIEGGTKPTFTGFDRRASARASTVGLDVSKKSPSMKAKQVKGAGKGGYSGLTEKTACAHSTSQMGDEEAERERKQAMNLVMLG